MNSQNNNSHPMHGSFSNNLQNANMNQNSQKMMNKNNRKLIPLLMGAMFILLVATVGTIGFLYLDQKNENKELKEEIESSIPEKKAEKIVEELKKLITIEESERVNIQELTAENIEEFKKQDANFYKDAQIGQFIVVLPKTQRVLLFDDSTKKIVNFSSYNIQVELIPEDQIEDVEKPLTVEIRYIAGTPQETVDQIKNALTQASANYVVNATAQTVSSDYDGLTLILLKQEAKPKMSQNIIAHVGTNSIGTIMPEGETTSEADVVLIIGTLPQQPAENTDTTDQ